VSDGLPVKLRLKVITPRRLLVDAEVDEAFLPALDGQIGILPGHRPLMTALGRGPLEFRREGRTERFEVDGGYAEIHPDRVVVFTKFAAAE
jgi:F-type H+-transporting ATPase subunit epsilon